MKRPLAILLLAIGTAGAARAEVTRVDLARRADIGQSGYEKAAGTVYFSVDPTHPRNAVVVDLDKVPRTASGRVEFSADLYIIRPKDPMRGNGSVLVEVPNPGDRSLLRQFNRGNLNPDPEAESELGDKFLMRFGFTLAWVDGKPTYPVAGLAFVALRDLATWLKHDRRDVSSLRRALAYGPSLGGRFLRGFLHEGFNTDERDRPVFDGVMVHSAGATRLAADAVSEAIGGLLEAPRARENPPKVFYTNTSAEYWATARVAALMHTTVDGTADLTIPDHVRVYFLAGTQHAPGRFPARVTDGQQPENPVEYSWVLRALLLSMQRWVSAGTAPPSSAYPMLKDGTLVKANAAAFPPIPGVVSPTRVSAPAPRPLLVPAVDQDGNERAGIRLPDVAMPLATYTGWNFRNASAGASADLVPLLGSSIPFPATRSAREAAKDPRRSVEERYASRDAYLAEAEKVADALVLKGYLIIDDLPRILQRTSDAWDVLMDSRDAKRERF